MTIKNKFAILVLAIVLILPLVTQAQNRELIVEGDTQTSKRVALVIGNADYVNARKLSNPANDANDMAKALRDVGFEVISGTNLNLKQMTDKVREFGDKLKASGGVGLFYYAGHGVQVSNRNYLIPVEADITREDEIDFAALNFDQVLRKMAMANNGLNIVILDACRNNPFARSWSRGEEEGGLAQISAPTGTFIAYATSPDKTANDGTGRNGLYTAELLKFIKQPNITIEETFKEVRKAVKQASGDKQVPWDSSSLSGDFYFNNSSTVKNTGSQKPTLKRREPVQDSNPLVTNNQSDDEAIWTAIKGDTDQRNFAEFIKSFPKSKYVPLARQRLKQLQTQPPKRNNAELNKPANSNTSLSISNFQLYPAGSDAALISSVIFGLKASDDVKIFINGVEVSSKIIQQSELVIQLQGKYSELNINMGANEVYAIVNGVKTDAYTFKRFK